MDTKTIISIALVAIAFLLVDAKPFEETEDGRFLDLNERVEEYLRDMEQNSLQRVAASRNFWDWAKKAAHDVGKVAKVAAPLAIKLAPLLVGERFLDLNERMEEYLKEMEQNSLQRVVASRNFWDWAKKAAHDVGSVAKVAAPVALKLAPLLVGDRFVDTCNCSRQTSGTCAVTNSLCFSGSKYASPFRLFLQNI